MKTLKKNRTISTKVAGPCAAPSIPFEKFVLPNGLQIIFHVDRKLPVVHVNEWFHVGSKNERPGRTGFAHLFEHLMFQGSVNATGEYFAHVERAGANLREGGVNGTTSEDRTNYFVTVPSANLEYILWLESDRMATLADSLTQQELDNQREVVRNERRQGLENQPYGRAFKLIAENLFPAGHPYSWPVIGSHEDLVAASMEDVKQFFKTFYTTNNLSLCIAGDFDPIEARQLIEKYYGSMPPGPALDRPKTFVPALTDEKVVEVRDRVPQERVYLAWPSPQYFAKDEPELVLASSILTDGLSSRLNKKLVYELQICSNVSSFNDASELAGAFVVIATARPGSDLRRIEEIITQEIAAFAAKGPTKRELLRASTKWEYDFISGLERIGGFGGKADRLNAYNTYLGDPGKFGEDLARYRGVTAAGVRTAVDRWINTKKRLIVRFYPEQSGRSLPSALNRTVIPALGVDREFIVPPVYSAKLDNGLSVFVVERHELPKVSVVLATKAGSISDPPDRMGVAQLSIRTIDRGTPSMDSIEIEEAFGDLGTTLHGLAGREVSYLSFDVLKTNLVRALSILSDVVRRPTFPGPEFERERDLHLDSLKQESNNPNAIAARVRAMLVFGRSHVYGRPARGVAATVGSITRDDLVRFHKTHWNANDSALVFTGDIAMDEAMKIAEKHFGSWTEGPVPVIEIPQPEPVRPGMIFLVDRQDAAQTVISQILSGPGRTTEDYYTLKLADAVWGGGFMTRLNLNLREDKGYTYGAFSNLAFLSRAGMWFATGSVETAKTAEAVVEFVKELKNLSGEKPISAQELGEAKANRLRGFAQQFESLGRVAGQITELWSHGLPMSDLQREATELAKATVDSVNASVRRYANPANAMLLLVGDLSKIEKPIRELNLARVVILDVEGNEVH